jgi:hypothetical protein
VGTDAPGVLAAIFTADCVPIFLVDIKTRRVLLVHAGWRGTLAGIASNAVQALMERGSNPTNIIAWIGPSIDVCCYEVSAELAEEFARQFPNARNILHGRHLNLKQLNGLQLASRGIPGKNIRINQFCTKCNREYFYSYRAGDRTGRIINAAMIL